MEDRMIEEGVVISVFDGIAKVRAIRGSSCGGCASRSMCKPMDNTEVIIEAKNDAGAHIGERVEIAIRPKTFLKASFIAYIIPLVSFFAGAVIGKGITGADIWAALCGLLFMILCYLGIWLYNKKVDSEHKYRPVIIAVVSS